MESFILGLVCMYVIYLFHDIWTSRKAQQKKLNEKLDLIDKENKRLKKIIFDLTNTDMELIKTAEWKDGSVTNVVYRITNKKEV